MWVMVYLIASFAIIPMHQGLLVCCIMIAVSYHTINIQLKMYEYCRVYKLETSTRGYLYRHIQYATAHIMMVRQKGTDTPSNRKTDFIRET